MKTGLGETCQTDTNKTLSNHVSETYYGCIVCIVYAFIPHTYLSLLSSSPSPFLFLETVYDKKYIFKKKKTYSVPPSLTCPTKKRTGSALRFSHLQNKTCENLKHSWAFSECSSTTKHTFSPKTTPHRWFCPSKLI